jgi:hypothetical protein
MNELNDPILQQLWRFVPGDVPAAQFEQWAYNEPDLEDYLGRELYLETISTNFSDKRATWSIAEALAHDPARWQRSMALMTEEVMPRLRQASPPAIRQITGLHPSAFMTTGRGRAAHGPPGWRASARVTT